MNSVIVSWVKCLLLQPMNCRSPKENLLNFSRIHLQIKIFLGWRLALPLGLISARQWLSPTLSLPMLPKDQQQEERCWKVRQDRRTPCEQSPGTRPKRSGSKAKFQTKQHMTNSVRTSSTISL